MELNLNIEVAEIGTLTTFGLQLLSPQVTVPCNCLRNGDCQKKHAWNSWLLTMGQTPVESPEPSEAANELAHLAMSVGFALDPVWQEKRRVANRHRGISWYGYTHEEGGNEYHSLVGCCGHNSVTLPPRLHNAVDYLCQRWHIDRLKVDWATGDNPNECHLLFTGLGDQWFRLGFALPPQLTALRVLLQQCDANHDPTILPQHFATELAYCLKFTKRL